MYDLIKKLFPIPRSITGDGVRETLKILGEHVPIKIYEVPTGTKVFDWEVPKEWNIKDAYVMDESGNKIIDFKKSNLSVVGYSVPVDKTVTLSELQEHLHSIPEQPDAIPYITSYYKERWGFCIAQNDREKLKEIETERKKEIEEAESLIRDSMREINEASEKKHVPIAQVKAADISQLLTAEEKHMFKTARFESALSKSDNEAPAIRGQQDLEEVAMEEAKKTGPVQSGKPIYGQALEDAKKGMVYSNKMSVTGSDTGGGSSPGEIYSSKSVTGEEGPESMYGSSRAGAIEERTSGMYGKKEEEKKHKHEVW